MTKYFQKIIWIPCLLFSCLMEFHICSAQEGNPVMWQISSQQIDSRTFEIHCKAVIKEPWHIYSQDTPEGIALPTSISFDHNPLISFQGKLIEKGQLEQKEEEGELLKYYSSEVDFVQTVTLKGNIKASLKGTISFMACTDERCLPPAVRKFTIAIGTKK